MAANKITLDDINEAAEKKFGATEIELGDETVRLLNPMRLPKEKRQVLMTLDKQLQAEDADQVEVLREAIKAAAESTKDASKLIKALGEDLAKLAAVFELYTKGSQVGEA